jgi:hypothetical protein
MLRNALQRGNIKYDCEMWPHMMCVPGNSIRCVFRNITDSEKSIVCVSRPQTISSRIRNMYIR